MPSVQHPSRPEAAAGPVFAGIDWASTEHEVCLIDAEGRRLARTTLRHTATGIAALLQLLATHHVHAVGIERGDGPLVAALLAAGITLFVIPPSQVKGLRSRYGSAGNKDDRFDAYLLADTVRTDRARRTPLLSDQPATTTLRTLVRARADLVKHRTALGNQLRAHLDTTTPALPGLFSELTLPITRAFITDHPTQDHLNALTEATLHTWLRQHRYRHRPAAVLLAHIREAPAGISGPTAATLTAVTHAYLNAYTTLIDQINTLETQIAAALAEHPDAAIFQSLPRAGTVRAARLLAEIGDARGRFPTPDSLTGQAGVTPSTRQSGKTRIVAYRWAADKQLRGAVCDFAADSRHSNPWAANLYQQARNRGHKHPHAVRILARAWLHIIWKCWTTNTPYNPTNHHALQTILNQPPNT